MTGVRRILNNAADRALAAGPPTKAQEAWYAATWAGTGQWCASTFDGALSNSTNHAGCKDGHRWGCLIAHGTERQGTWAPGIAPTIWSDLGPA